MSCKVCKGECRYSILTWLNQCYNGDAWKNSRELLVAEYLYDVHGN